ncbi:serine/threonine protein phosphatase [Plantactinospora sp. B6F1]|uniref:serine/threonine protein phosphatase n=1 Tax=Plantactinospora sp. B6F1 TaxID=3158971 RepID=UPI0032D8D8EA
MSGLPDDSTDMSHPARVLRYGDVSTSLALLNDHQLGQLVATAQENGSGIGGTWALLDVAGVPVFVKRIALTDLERQPRNIMSTANLFELPMFYQYGVAAYGSSGFGAWREVAANTMTTNWVLAKRTEAFPLMYHWRVLPGAVPLADELAEIDRVVAYWDGSAAVRRRLHALAEASASVVLCLEYIPGKLDAWLADQLASGPDIVADACARAQRCLSADIAFMNTNGLLHFDAHLGNILTDGRRLYLADLGLAISSRFDLSPDERNFVAQHTSHDAGYLVRDLLNWMVANVVGIAVPDTGGPVEHHDYIRRCAAGARPVGVPESVAELITRYAPVAAVMNGFYWKFFGETRTAPYPAQEITQELSRIPGAGVRRSSNNRARTNRAASSGTGGNGQPVD